MTPSLYKLRANAQRDREFLRDLLLFYQINPFHYVFSVYLT